MMVWGVYPFTVQMERREQLHTGSDIWAGFDGGGVTSKAEKDVAFFRLLFFTSLLWPQGLCTSICLCLESFSHRSSSVQSFKSQFLCHFLGKPDFLSQILSLMSAHSSRTLLLSSYHSCTFTLFAWLFEYLFFPGGRGWVFWFKFVS